MSQEIEKSSILILRPHARILQVCEEYLVDDVEGEYRFSGRAASILGAVRHHLDGTREVVELARECCVAPADLAETLRPLVLDEVIVDVSTLLSATCPSDFLRHYFPLCDAWGRLIFAWPFWETLASGSASSAQVLGWGVQFFHRVVGADQHNALALHYCTDPPLRVWLEEHFHEEANHAGIFLDGLQACGIDRDAIEASTPLPGTSALVEYLNGLAVADTLTYLACYGVMHSPRVGQTAKATQAQYDAWIDYYPFATSFLRKVCEHALLDIGLGHDQTVFERFLSEKQQLQRQEAMRVLGAIHGITRAFNVFFSGIYQYYISLSGPFPGGYVPPATIAR